MAFFECESDFTLSFDNSGKPGWMGPETEQTGRFLEGGGRAEEALLKLSILYISKYFKNPGNALYSGQVCIIFHTQCENGWSGVSARKTAWPLRTGGW
jgi:hypothetical protein